ncbi:MAG: flagellar basal-body rod protein FlgF [Rickettsiales bacterium]
MDNSIYIALSRETALFRNMDMVANNLANVTTTGYQGEKMMFTDYLVDDGNQRKMAFTQDISSYIDTKGGPMKETGNPLDAAISGPGYFVIRTPGGERYTKAGTFLVNNEGQMVTPDGFPVLDEGGQPVEFAPEDKTITIGEGGNIKVDGEERSTLQVVEFQNPQELEREGNTLFRSKTAPLPAEHSRVLQGVVEQSNVSPVQELVEMTKVNRSVSNTAKFVEVMYDLQRKTNQTYAQQSAG